MMVTTIFVVLVTGGAVLIAVTGLAMALFIKRNNHHE